MAPVGAQYTVFGFDNRIDWKPTVFVNGIPKNRVCNACGLVSAAIALLPCGHLLCSRCYDGSGDEECNRCPLDTESCKPEDVIWSTFTRKNLLERKIQCWNASSGCDVVGQVCQVMDHFGEDCQYHAVTCFRCKRTMAYKELADHLKVGDCNVRDASPASSNHRIPDATVALLTQWMGELREKLSSMQTSFNETKELIADQTHVFRERAAADMLIGESVQTLDNTLKESMSQSQVGAGRTAEELALMRKSISAIMNTLHEVAALAKETKTSVHAIYTESTSQVSSACRDLQQKLTDFTASSAERLNQELDVKEILKSLNERLNGELSEKLSLLVNGVRASLQSTFSISEPFSWTIEKWSDLKQEATLKGEAMAFAGKPMYFYGYSLLLGVRIKKTDSGHTLHLCYHICRGDYDSLLTWPFQKKLECYVLNDEEKEIAQYITVDTSIVASKAKEMPTKARNDELWSTMSIEVTDIESNGCVKNDKVSIKVKVTKL